MNIDGIHHTTIDYIEDSHCISIIDQTKLPHHFKRVELKELSDFCTAISTMQVRGAPLIGITAAYGLAFASVHGLAFVEEAYKQLLATRPTAINLKWALDQTLKAINAATGPILAHALDTVHRLRSEDISHCEAIGEIGAQLIQQVNKPAGKPINILTHCNAGWLATVDWGTALSPIYKAFNNGVNIHVWVDETRPRNQGAALTAWELEQHGIPHTLISDNTGGHLMQQGLVDLCLVGSDRTTAQGDVCNKIGTYLKALAAYDNNIPFYVALPTSTIDWSITDGMTEIPIEQRNPDEVLYVQGLNKQGNIDRVKIANNSPAANYAFDVTPARLITGLITEKGYTTANSASLKTLAVNHDLGLLT